MAIHIGVDVGGTFTDFAVSIPSENTQLFYKLPSTPSEPDKAILDGLEHLLNNNSIEPRAVLRFAHGTTVGTNALIQRKIGKVAIVTSKGFRDLLEIGRQTRPKVYDMHQDFPAPLVPRWLRFEVSERMRADGKVHVPLNEEEIRIIAKAIISEDIDCVAICFLHSHAFPAHEERAAEILKDLLGERTSVMTSSMVYPEFREYERFSTTVLNAALLTVMSAYLDRLTKQVKRLGLSVEPTISQSGGGLMSVAYSRQYPIRSALSGPAAGALGAAYRAVTAKEENIITLDIGGTSADVSLLAAGTPSVVHSRRLAGFPLRLPALDVNAVGAGGGSIAWIDRDGLLKVGPESAGAVPGPACYDKGGEKATVTDANVLLGRLPDDALLDGQMSIRRDLSESSIGSLARELGMTIEDTALGIVQVACAVIVKAIRAISVERGHNPATFTLFAYGGAGPLHAMEVARELGIKRVFIPPHPGILCAEGLLGSDLVADFVQPALNPFGPDAQNILEIALENLNKRAAEWFDEEEIEPTDRRTSWAIDLRYEGQNFELPIPFGFEEFNKDNIKVLRAAFDSAHELAYGYCQPNEPAEVVSMRAKLTGVLSKPPIPTLRSSRETSPISNRMVSFGQNNWVDTPIIRREELAPGELLNGPIIIEQMDSISLIFPGDTASVDSWGNLIVNLKQVGS